MGFSLSRFQYLDINGVFCAGGRNGAAPGECYYYRQGLYKIGILLHLATILRVSGIPPIPEHADNSQRRHSSHASNSFP